MSINMLAGLIPKIEGFQPIPNAVMIPFMETQSAALAFGFGLNYEYGKRTIRSMSNETFNSLTSEQIAEMSANHSTILLQRFIQAVPQVMPAQTEIFKQYVAIEKLKVQQNVALAKWMVQYAKQELDDATAHLLGGHLHGDILEPYTTDPNKFINPITGEQGASATSTTTIPIIEPDRTVTAAGTLEPPLTNTLTEAQEFTTWQANLIRLQSLHISQSHQYSEALRTENTSGTVALSEKAYLLLKRHANQIKNISDDYRSTNNGIRVAAIELRQEIANGKWAVPKFREF